MTGGHDTSSVPRASAPLAEAELQRALVLAQSGDAAARERVVQSHLRLVWDIARRFFRSGVEADDLFQLGCLGLVKAIDRYDPSFGTKFSTYAVPLILGEIRRFLRDDAPVRVARPLKELAFRALARREELTQTLGREPTVAEVAHALNVEPADLSEALEAARPPVSLFKDGGEEAGDSLYLIDQLAARGDVAATAAGRPARQAGSGESAFLESLALKEAMERLDERARGVLRMRFFEDYTQAEVGEVLGVSQVQVSRLERQALLRLREMLGS